MKYFFVILITLVLSHMSANGQQHPPSMKWQVLESPHFNVVFPNEIEGEAQKVVNQLEHYYRSAGWSLDTVPSRISIYLSNRSTVSNGYVRLFPRMSLWYTTPYPDGTRLGNDNWLRSMGIHEYRHIVQFDKANQKTTKFFSRFLGDFARGGLAWSVPAWFVEGDAVVTETALTAEGRGRLPQFDMGMRASLLEGRKVSYEQAYLGSYSTYFPNYYSLGYHLVNYGRREYGEKVWSKVTDRYSWYPFWPYAFSRATKRYTGKNVRGLYESAMSDLTGKWMQKTEREELTSFEVVESPQKLWTNYLFPQVVDSTAYVAIRSGKSHASSLVRIDGLGEESYLCRLPSQQMNSAGNKVVWVENYKDLRWGERDYSDLVVFDITTKKRTRLTEKKQLFSPCFSKDGKLIVAVEYTSELKSSLVVFDASTGKELQRWSHPSNDTFRQPNFSGNGEEVVFTNSTIKGGGIGVWNRLTGEYSPLKEYSWENVSHPIFVQNKVVFHSAKNGRDAIWSIDQTTKKEVLLVNGKYGITAPSYSGGALTFQEYTADGYRIGHQKLASLVEIPFDSSKYLGINYQDSIVAQEGGSVFKVAPDSVSFPTRKHNWYRGLINFHSLLFMPGIPNVSAYALSRNHLNTFDITVGGAYNNNERVFKPQLQLVYKGLFPRFTFMGEYAKIGQLNTDPRADVNKLYYHERDLSLNVELPFNFSHGAFSKQLGLYGLMAHNIITDANGEDSPLRFPTQSNFVAGGGAYFLVSRQGASRDVGVRLGLSLSAYYKQYISAGSKDILSLSSTVYLPGIGRHHALKVEGVFENKNSDNQLFSSRVAFSRGYTYFQHTNYKRLSVDYALPLFHPDWRLGALMYINRFRSNLFCDLAKVDGYSRSSMGVELNMDVYLFRIKYPLSIGVRTSHLLTSGTYYTEMVLGGINLNFY